MKRILVTGANKGIGKAICKQLLVDYPDVHVLLGARNGERGSTAVQSILGEIGTEFHSRIDMIEIDVTNDASVINAAELIKNKFSGDSNPLYGVVNNAGIGVHDSIQMIIDTNYWGVKRVIKSMLPLISQDGNGRIVNISSGAASMYFSKCTEEEKVMLLNPSLPGEALDGLVQSKELDKITPFDLYAFSKASLNTYTIILAQKHPKLIINSCTPGFIDTDLTKGFGATLPPEMGTKSALHLLFCDVSQLGSGRYYGSDGVRSPLDKYRGPGDPPYEP